MTTVQMNYENHYDNDYEKNFRSDIFEKRCKDKINAKNHVKKVAARQTKDQLKNEDRKVISQQNKSKKINLDKDIMFALEDIKITNYHEWSSLSCKICSTSFQYKLDYFEEFDCVLCISCVECLSNIDSNNINTEHNYTETNTKSKCIDCERPLKKCESGYMCRECLYI